MRVCWIGSHRYTQPLDSTDEKKWRLLRGLGIEIDVIAFSHDMRPRRFTQHAHFYLLPELPAALLRYIEMFLCAPLLLLWLVLRDDVQVIISQSPFDGAIGALVKQISRLFGKQIKLVVESHGDFEEALFKQRRITFRGLYRCLMKASARYAFRHVDALRAVSSATRAQLEGWSPDKPLEQFMAWTDFSIFQESRRKRTPCESWDIVYAGVLTPLKAVHVLIEAFSRLHREFPQAHLFVIGKAQDMAYKAGLEQQVESLGSSAKVHFLGRLSQTELAQRLASARALALPSTSEGLPRVLIEAMLCGTPVIATRVGGIPDIVEEGVNGYLVPANDVDALAERLRAVLNDPEIDAMGERARAFATRFFSENAYLEGYRRLIDSTALRSRG
jgi:glycosyltransferase involved in cell wall biosynthesis